MPYFGVACPERFLSKYVILPKIYSGIIAIKSGIIIPHIMKQEYFPGAWKKTEKKQKTLPSSLVNVTGIERNVCSLSFKKVIWRILFSSL